MTSITTTDDDDETTTTTTTQTNGFAMGAGAATTTTTTSSDEDDTDTVISVCPTDEMTVTLNVDESDILSLSVGQEAEITIDSLGEDTYTGTVTEIDTVGTSSSGVTTYDATLTLDKVDGMLAGMTADAVITIEGKDDALLIPVDAVHQTSATSYVYTSYDEESGEYGDMVEVVTGLSNSQYIEITSGLSEGDTVYYQESDDSDEFDFSKMGGGSMPGGGNMGGGNMGGGNMGGGHGGGQMPGM